MGRRQVIDFAHQQFNPFATQEASPAYFPCHGFEYQRPLRPFNTISLASLV
jgi:hypothetical protein